MVGLDPITANLARPSNAGRLPFIAELLVLFVVFWLHDTPGFLWRHHSWNFLRRHERTTPHTQPARKHLFLTLLRTPGTTVFFLFFFDPRFFLAYGMIDSEATSR